MVGAGAIIEVFVICQLEKVSISLAKGEIPKLHCLSSRYLDRKTINQVCT